MSDYTNQRRKERELDSNRLELMVAELEDMKSRHHSAYFKIKCTDAINQLKLGQGKLKELNEQWDKVKGI